jgi:hypothetical protein
MPQMKIEKKFFPIRVSKKSRKNEATIFQSLTVIKFQGLQKNIAGGEE